jgi:hypothetical protein
MVEKKLKFVFSLQLSEVVFELVGHCEGIDTSDIAVVLKLDNLSEIAFPLFPCEAVRKK